jgi:hypothetical protein
MQKFAHLYKNPKARGGGYELLISSSPAIQAEFILARISPLTGKREANKIAREYNATPHNF